MTYDVQTPEAARLWPYIPDWRSGFDVRRSFKTDIATSRNNTEQRRALRDEPRLACEYRVVVAEDELRDANNFLRAWQNKPTIVPDFARWARLTATSTAGATTLDVSPLPAWAATGQNLILCGEGNVMERVTVAGVAGTTITLEGSLVATWASGSVIRPTFFGLMESKVASRRWNRGAAQFEVTIDCYPGGTPPRDTGTAWATLNDREIFTLQPDYRGQPSIAGLWPMDRIDYQRGRTAQFRPVEEAQRLVEADFRALSAAQAAQTEQFFDRMKGRRGAFYVPTYEKDYVLAASALSGSSAFLAEGPTIAADFGSIDYADTDEAVAICLTDGTTLYRRITDISASAGNSLISVDSSWGVALNSGNVARISRMPLYRFASDEMVMSWQTPLHADTSLAFQGVKA